MVSDQDSETFNSIEHIFRIMLINISFLLYRSLFYIVVNASIKKGGYKKPTCVVFTSISKVTRLQISVSMGMGFCNCVSFISPFENTSQGA